MILIRSDKLENLSLVLEDVIFKSKNANQISKEINLSPATVRKHIVFLNNNLICYEFIDFKKVYVRINGKPRELTVLCKPAKLNDNLFNKIMDFIENPTQRNFMLLKLEGLKHFSRITLNINKYPPLIIQKVVEWMRTTNRKVVKYFREWRDKYYPPPN